MENINSVVLVGNLVAAPSLKSDTVLTFSIAVNERRKDDDDEWADYPNFIDCVLFGARCKPLSEMMDKGMRIAVSGRLHQNRWETDDGENRSRLEVVVSNVEIMTIKIDDDSKKSGGKDKSSTKKKR